MMKAGTAVVGAAAGFAGATLLAGGRIKQLERALADARAASSLHTLSSTALSERKAKTVASFDRKHDVGSESGSESYVNRIVLTGGPCGGKSSSLKHFTTKLVAKGFDVYTAPEIPTVLINGGCDYPGDDGGEKLIAFEKALLELQLQLERSFTRIAASTGRPSVVVFDRGLLDAKAYCPPEAWATLMAGSDDLDEEMFKARYDLVLHLVTAADGAEKFYTTSNNAARTETAEEARVLDAKILSAWSAHPNVARIANVGSFSAKLDTAAAHVVALVEGGE